MIRKRIRSLLLLNFAMMALLAMQPVLLAGDISLSPSLTDDASTGISPAKTYTHTISGGTAATINGVAMDALNSGATPANFDWNTNGFTKDQIGCCNNGDWVPAGGGVTGSDLITLLGSFTYSSNGADTDAKQTFTLSGLDPGTMYDTRMYVRVWDTEASGRPIDLTFTNGSEVDSILGLMEDHPAEVLGGAATNQDAYYISYEYTAQTTDLVIDAVVVGGAASGSYHLYALTNEVVPEPGSIVLAAMALLGMLSFGRRRR